MHKKIIEIDKKRMFFYHSFSLHNCFILYKAKSFTRSTSLHQFCKRLYCKSCVSNPKKCYLLLIIMRVHQRRHPNTTQKKDCMVDSILITRLHFLQQNIKNIQEEHVVYVKKTAKENKLDITAKRVLFLSVVFPVLESIILRI